MASNSPSSGNTSSVMPFPSMQAHIPSFSNSPFPAEVMHNKYSEVLANQTIPLSTGFSSAPTSPPDASPSTLRSEFNVRFPQTSPHLPGTMNDASDKSLGSLYQHSSYGFDSSSKQKSPDSLQSITLGTTICPGSVLNHLIVPFDTHTVASTWSSSINVLHDNSPASTRQGASGTITLSDALGGFEFGARQKITGGTHFDPALDFRHASQAVVVSAHPRCLTSTQMECRKSRFPGDGFRPFRRAEQFLQRGSCRPK
ncbi:hypothetical protein HYPSUDRAFT_43905 [Hypholoma sublateritium FD-334 SS-4]|uniref:Uncharacterized protein n=1 Tax=Hypholoma sublateritium (strain FD-334 SS-4) TaxID=945553 RepID=A0A0D2NLP4_HYPSF|nr:hypothetical protein HYPSUDRAFT_43905 [Hypholoma sublateritium FD-334 SS-4]